MLDSFVKTYLVEGLRAIGSLLRRLFQRSIPLIMIAGVVMAGDNVAVERDDGDSQRAGEAEIPRDPFWPVGYEPPRPEDPEKEPEEPEAPDEPEEPEAPEIEPPDWEAAIERINFQGRFEGRGRILASVNGRIVEKDSVLGVRLTPYVYYFRIIAIRQDGVETEPVEAIPME